MLNDNSTIINLIFQIIRITLSELKNLYNKINIRVDIGSKIIALFIKSTSEY